MELLTQVGNACGRVTAKSCLNWSGLDTLTLSKKKVGGVVPDINLDDRSDTGRFMCFPASSSIAHFSLTYYLTMVKHASDMDIAPKRKEVAK